LIINAKTGKPVSFVFVGNRKFSAEDFLETINLFNRKQPFGNNTINILIQNIERKYREAGYLYATISSTKTEEPATGRITYVVTIEEDTPTRVAAVTLSGNNSLSTEDLERLAGEISVEENERIFSPRYAVAEDIEQNISTLKGIYVEQGYPNTEITYQLKPLDEADKVEIRYTVIEGSEVRADWLALEGMPADISAPPPPPAPYSIPKANRYIDELLEVLRSRGFLKPALWSDIEPGSSRMTIHVQPGMLTRIGKILFESDPGISRDTIQRNIAIKKDGAWDADAINESKRKLLRLGLFSRVEISPVDGNLDSEYEDIVVRLSERPLTTLEVGTGINSEFGFHAFGEATDRGIFRDGRTLTLRADLYYDPSEQDISQGVAGLRYSDPYFLSTNFSLAEELRFEKLDLSTLEFNLDRISLSSFLYRSWDSGFSTSFGHTISEDKLTEVSPDAILSDLDRGNVRLSFLSAVFGYDRRNNPLNPTSGYNLNLDMKLANEALWSDANYFAVGGRGSLTAPVKGTRFSFAFNTRAASSWTYGGTEQIPITQRYYLGGRNSVRAALA
jgi:outer membrane protein insertion porin family